jgi:haloalkane dehalogenase
MEFLRINTHCFENLPDYAFTSNYIMVEHTEGGQLGGYT